MILSINNVTPESIPKIDLANSVREREKNEMLRVGGPSWLSNFPYSKHSYLFPLLTFISQLLIVLHSTYMLLRAVLYCGIHFNFILHYSPEGEYSEIYGTLSRPGVC